MLHHLCMHIGKGISKDRECMRTYGGIVLIATVEQVKNMHHIGGRIAHAVVQRWMKNNDYL